MFDPAQFEGGARNMITTSATCIVLAFALVMRAVSNMNWNSMAAPASQAYFASERVAGIRRRGGGAGARGCRTWRAPL